MTAINPLEAAQVKLTELAALIAEMISEQNEPASTLITIAEIQIELIAGEHYAGAVLDADGKVVHHLVLMAEKPTSNLTWRDAMDWAAEIGGELPTRQEQALLYANCKPHMDEAWHWSGEEVEGNASYAWNCYFGNGYQSYDRKSYEGSARAVRRLIPSVL